MSSYPETMSRAGSTPAIPVGEVDFTWAIVRAFQQAPVLQAGEVPADVAGEVDGWAGSLAPLADSEWRAIPYEKQPNEVVTKTALLHHRLLRQTCEVLWPDQQVPYEEIDDWVDHERQHAAISLVVNPLLALFYGVRIHRSQEPDGQIWPRISPFVGAHGHMRKIDMARVAIAPVRPSVADLRVVHALGYGSPQEVRERHAASY